MAKKETTAKTPEQGETPKTKMVFNRGYNKIELVHNGELYVFPVNQYTEAPAEMDIPTNLGLYVR